MSALNQVTIMGRLTAKPELKFTSNGGFPVCSFTLAVDRPYRKGGEHEKETDFSAWSRGVRRQSLSASISTRAIRCS